MKTTRISLTVALAMTASLLAAETQARGSHSSGHSSSHARSFHSTGSGRNFSSVHNVHQGNFCDEYYASDELSCDAALPDVAPIPSPATKIVRIVNPLETQTTLAFAVNGQTYSLDAGKAQELELADSAVIEFD